MPDIFDSAEFSEMDQHPNHVDEEESRSRRKSNKNKKHIDEYSEVIRSELSSSNPLDAFAPKPLHVFFDSQEKTEQVILLLRRHPVTQITWVVVAILMLFAPLLFNSISMFAFLPPRFGIAATFIWYLLVMGFAIESFLTWFFSVFIITDERIIDVDFLSLIYKNISAAKIDNIEDITAETGGAIRSIFNFGTVKMQTAGANNELEFEDVPQPAKITRLLNELLLEEEREKVEGRVN